MSIATPEAPAATRTVADLVHDLGDIPLQRIRLTPPIGTATPDDLLRVKGCELIDGTLVEKAMGIRESYLGAILIQVLLNHVMPRNLGMVTGEQGGMELAVDLIRIPDVAFISWDRLPDKRIPTEPYPAIGPDLAVEVLSRSNTPREMARKRQEFFAAGTRLIWEIDAERRIATVYSAPESGQVLTEADTLDGGKVLPGFTLPLAELFRALDRQG